MRNEEWNQHRQNLRQSVLNLSRVINQYIVDGLNKAGYPELKATHTTLLSHLDLNGNTITQTAARANISKQAMGRLAAELASLGYIRVQQDQSDKRNSVLIFTDQGIELMQTSFEIMGMIETHCANTIGSEKYKQFVKHLTVIRSELEDKKSE